MKILSRSETREIDQSVLKKGLTLGQLIEEVGEALFQWFLKNIQKNRTLLFLIGPGNNGNDGLCLASKLLSHGYSLKILTPENSSSSEIRKSWLKDLPAPLRNVSEFSANVVVDAFFGVGLDRSPDGFYKEAIEQVNLFQATKIAIDIPSGLNSDTGEIFETCFRADHTLTISAGKPGLWLLPGHEVCGEISIVPVESLDRELEAFPSSMEELTDQSHLLRKCSASSASHKYNRGEVCLVMCETYPGAALLAAEAAQRSGAGYIKLLVPENRISQCQVEYPQYVFKSYESYENLIETLQIQKVAAFVLGPGWDLPTPDFSQLRPLTRMVIDGGLLNAETWAQTGRLLDSDWVFTPHLGELKRMTGGTGPKVKMVEKFLENSRFTLIAKGFDTLIAQKDHAKQLTTWNSPSLAMAGSGDILAGMTGAFLAQGLSGFEASCLAVDLHRKAAGHFPKALTPPLLLESLTQVINQT